MTNLKFQYFAKLSLIHTHAASGAAAAPVKTGSIKLVVLRETFHTHAAAAAAGKYGKMPCRGIAPKVISRQRIRQKYNLKA